jgi:hypothetical protein
LSDVCLSFPASAKPAVQASASAAGQKDTVRSAFLTFTSAASMPWVAKGAGIYDKYGLDVSLTYIAPATLNQTLLAGKDLDVGYGSAANLVTLDAQGGDLVILAASIQGGWQRHQDDPGLAGQDSRYDHRWLDHRLGPAAGAPGQRPDAE